jgi:ABC-type transport system involved in multi-copper enzyme maturation permease subunit
MAVYRRTYKAYTGPLTPSWSRFLVLSRYGLSKMFESRPFTAFTMACMVPFLVGLVFVYVVHNQAVQSVLNVRMGPNALIDNLFFFRFMGIEAWLAFLLTAWFGPGMISKDFANHGIQLYLSRPLSRAEYLCGKISVLAILLSGTTWIPALVLFVVNAEMVGRNWGWENLWVAGAIVVSGLLWIALISLIAMALSVWVRWRIAATALIFAVFFLLPGFGEAMNAILRTQWGKLLNLGYLISTIWGHLFLTGSQLRWTGFNLIPLWSAWTMLLAVCAFAVWILNLRLRAREVERG